ncbi:AEC family transporter [Paramagnetospirillum kuznetsovii]|uniref:AEC family transporter n=1 Tax=Paramagnetospirillum kuznetsovii TaxID=2053833 RepID=A0A364P1T3_9PROT|nr:AEC family transporter [Paramagnetospirillum kuznetsovii]RAU23220.1 AEC family transporter [Paramagnetospirillum kuznetsovii]
MGAVLAALLPIVVLIALGHQLRARRWVDDGFWPGAERVTYYILLPALLVGGLARARLTGLPVGAMAAVLALGVTAVAVGIALTSRWLLNPAMRLDGPGLTSLFQCSLRPNTYVGLAIASGLWGGEGVALTAVCLATVIPLANVLCVMAMLRWAASPQDGGFRWKAVILPILRNPLILSCLVGIGLNLGGIGLAPPLDAVLRILAGASLPLGLLAVGAGLSLHAAKTAGPAVLLSILLKMALLPLVVWGLGVTADLGGIPLAICILYTGLPAAPASYVLARQMGGDAPLVATMLSVQTLAAALILPAWIWLVGLN